MHQLFRYVQECCLIITQMMSEIVKNEIQIRIKSRTEIHCTYTNNAYVYLSHMCCESAAERGSHKNNFTVPKKCWSRHIHRDLQPLNRFATAVFKSIIILADLLRWTWNNSNEYTLLLLRLSVAIESKIGRANCLRCWLVWQQSLRQRVLTDPDQVVHTYLQIVVIPQNV